jgi:hypothetical protein
VSRKNITVDATFVVAGGKDHIATLSFLLKPSDYGIVIPGDKAESISNNIEITVNAKSH